MSAHEKKFDARLMQENALRSLSRVNSGILANKIKISNEISNGNEEKAMMKKEERRSKRKWWIILKL